MRNERRNGLVWRGIAALTLAFRRGARQALTVLLAAMVAGTCMGDEGAIGVVLMHGKGGSPSGWVADLAGALERQGVLVANIEMPWLRISRKVTVDFA